MSGWLKTTAHRSALVSVPLRSSIQLDIVDCFGSILTKKTGGSVRCGVMHAGSVSFRQAVREAFEYHCLKPGWRKDRATAPKWNGARFRALGRLRGQLRQLRYEWTAGAVSAAASERLIFSTESDDSVFLNIFERGR